MEIAICEDNKKEATLLSEKLQKHLEQNDYLGNIHIFHSGEALIKSFAPGKFDVVFMDVYMKEKNGVETARVLREQDPNFALVFITISKEHAMDAFSVRACAYVPKPIKQKALALAFRQCEPVFSRNARCITITSERSKIKVPIVKIQYIEAVGRNILVHTSKERFGGMAPTTFHCLIDSLGSSFVFCHRSYIVNMNHIKTMQLEGFQMQDDRLIPIRQRDRNQLRERYSDFLSERLFEV